MNLAVKISFLAKEKGVPHRKLAQACGLTDQAMCNRLSQRVAIKAEEIPAIAKVLGVTPNDIFEWEVIP